MKIFLSLVFVLLSSAGLFGQNRDRAKELIHSLNGLVFSGKIDQAVKNTIELEKISPPLLDYPFNNDFFPLLNDENRQKEPDKSACCLEYFRQLYQAGNPNIRSIIWPVIQWGDICEAENSTDKTNLVHAFIEQLPPDSLEWRIADTYSLLIMKGLDNSQMGQTPVYHELLQRVQMHLLSGYQKKPDDNLIRYHLSYLWYYLSTKDPAGPGVFLKKASDASPDNSSTSFYYVTSMLDPSLQRKGFRTEYYDYLIGLGKIAEALPVMESITLQEATDVNLEMLRKLYQQTCPDKGNTFAEYWSQAVSSFCQNLPAHLVSKDDAEKNEFWAPMDKWTIIVIWGTWCKPCMQELPKVQKLYVKNLQARDSMLHITTWAYDQTLNVVSLFAEKKYTFPVDFMTESQIRQFGINPYKPVKILITPDGKYLKIPSGVNWEEYLENYMGIGV